MPLKRSPIAGWIAVAIWFFLASTSISTSAAPSERDDSGAAQPTRPNIVLIISDDQAWTDYGFMGHPTIRTPNLDRLARESVLFRWGHVPTALCRPSLLTIITGRYAHQHGVTGNDPSPKLAAPDSEDYRKLRQRLIDRVDQWDTLPKLLGRAGYLSFQSGKWWEGNYQRGGFTHGMTRGFPLPGGRHGDDGLTIGRKGLEPIVQFVDHAMAEGRPFFVWYAPFLPHTPHDPPARLLDHYRTQVDSPHLARYFAMCEWFDETCGELVRMLEDRQALGNTLIVYVTDNGWIQREDDRGFADRSKQSPYEGGVRTPVMFHWPSRLPAADRPELCSSIDLMPTILAAAGVDPPNDLPGLNLLPAMERETPIDRQTIFGEGFAHDIADLDDPQASLLSRWCIDGRWKLIVHYDGLANRYRALHERMRRGPELFDLDTDPNETTNLAAEQPELVRRLSGKIEQWYPVNGRTVVGDQPSR